MSIGSPLASKYSIATIFFLPTHFGHSRRIRAVRGGSDGSGLARFAAPHVGHSSVTRGDTVQSGLRHASPVSYLQPHAHRVQQLQVPAGAPHFAQRQSTRSKRMSIGERVIGLPAL
jgi:hypothetical protein